MQVVPIKKMVLTTYWYISDSIIVLFKPINNDEFIVRGSEKTGMYGTNFLQVSTEPEEFIAYGWYHRLHTLAVSKAFRVIWNNVGPGVDRSSGIAIAKQKNTPW